MNRTKAEHRRGGKRNNLSRRLPTDKFCYIRLRPFRPLEWYRSLTAKAAHVAGTLENRRVPMACYRCYIFRDTGDWFAIADIISNTDHDAAELRAAAA
jgi:hypothetical protein